MTAAREPVEAANAVTPISLQWRADEPPPVLGVSVRLTDALGQIWAQHDYEPLGARRICKLQTAGCAAQVDSRVAGTPPIVWVC